jgi:hypothetical protein
MKSTSAIVACMAALGATLPAALLVWGPWSVRTALLTVAVLCFEGSLVALLAWRVRRAQRLARFGGPLPFAPLPTRHGPLRGASTRGRPARNRRC